eukprot:CAMPEP_0113463980 /NCGR_PEP_ID=MMETSP0014_2-20120614/12952_1 /TAXON_ID=2857 /ORGANISM="Nitzschia sp." /LENGTH=213 /DNA_ID=CAMNT_0000356021 /DNA_START=329 /DNA_END=970 /DNA_ORIENTATION=- /assembly_acc=CAM_ASM_000159
MPTSADRLLSQENQVYKKLYDPESLLYVSASVAQGYIVLLSGGIPPPATSNGGSTSSSSNESPSNDKKKKKNKKKITKKNSKQPDVDEDVSLAFMALTSGNVLDACFGSNTSMGSTRQTTPASRAVSDAKWLLTECDDNIVDDDGGSESFRKTAVHAYCDAFKAVVVHNDKMKKLNCITRCFKTKKIRTESEKNLQEAFGQLATMINEQPPSN